MKKSSSFIMVFIGIVFISVFIIGAANSFLSQGNRIFSGSFNQTDVELDPLSFAHSSVDSYDGRISDLLLIFLNREGGFIDLYYVPEDSVYFSDDGRGDFYFIANVPDETEMIYFIYNSQLIEMITFSGAFPEINNFEINVNEDEEKLEIKWNVSDLDSDELFVSLYYENELESQPLLFEHEVLSSEGGFSIPLDFVLSGENNFTLVVADYVHEIKESIIVVIPEIVPCGGADFNSDWKVDLQDFGIIKTGFGITGDAVKGDGDANGDGAVDLQDFGLFQANFGKGC